MERKQMSDNQLKQRDAVSDTPRTDTVAFGTDDESLNRLFGIRELPRYVVPVDFARILERELAAVTAERDALKAELDRVTTKCVAPALFQLEKIRTEQVMVAGLSGAANCISHARVALGDTWTEVDQNRDGYVDELHASQQEARRLREALEKETKAHSEIHDWCGSKLPLSEFEGGIPTAISKSLNAILTARAALSSTPVPVHKDTERDNLALNILLQSSYQLLLSIADEDDAGHFQINHNLRRRLDALCHEIKTTT